MCNITMIKVRMRSPIHPQANCAAKRTNQTMKQVRRTIVIAKLKEAPDASAASPNWLRLLDFVELDVNNAHIADTNLSPFSLDLWYHPQFFLDIPELDEELLREEQTISIN